MIEAFSIGPFLITTLQFSIVLSLVGFIWLASWIAPRLGLSAKRSRRVAEHAVWIGLIGARLGFAVNHWTAYTEAPWTILYIWQPGYLWWGGILAGTAYVLWCIVVHPPEERSKLVSALGSSFAGGAALLSALLGSAILLADENVLYKGDIVPDFNLETIDGQPVSFSNLEGDVVVLNFWATWCPPCRREMPLLDSMHKQYQSRGVSIIGIDLAEPVELVASYIKSIGVDYPVWVDSSSSGASVSTSELYARFGGVGLPTTFFVDHAGKIVDVHVGELSRGLLQSRIEYMLARRARSPSSS